MTRPDRVAIVTGAGKGLGRAYGLALAAKGVAVVVNNRWTDRSQPSSAASVVEEIRAAGGLAVASLEAAEAPDAGAAMVALALEHFGRLDAIVANAGIAAPTRFHRETPQAFRTLMDINFYGTLSVIEAAWPILSVSPAGRVIVSASSAGLHGGDGLASYGASKAALITLARSLAIEGRARNILVNAIAPYAATAMTGQDLSPDQKRRMSPDAVAPLVVWLAGPDCDVTGQTLIAGGGHLAAAYAVEAAPVDLKTAPTVAGAVHAALADGTRQSFSDAMTAFGAFLAADPKPVLD